MIRFSTLLLTFLLSTLGGAPRSAEAFIFIRGGAFDKGERPIASAPVWTARVVRFHVNTDLTAYGGSVPAEVTGAEFLSAVQASVNAWASACRSDLRVEVAGTTTATLNPDDQINVVAYDNQTDGEGNTFQDNLTLAAATSVMTSSNEFFDCDILVNGNSVDTFTVAATPVAGENDLQSILTHEIGHCLGLDHPVEPPAYTSASTFLTEASLVQSAVVGAESTIRRTINQDDKDGIDCVYERGLPFRSGTRCSSYHGTNGGGEIAGAQTGGPDADRGNVCGSSGDARTVMPDSEAQGSGCMKNAVAGEATSGESLPRALMNGPWGWISFILLFYFVRKLFRRVHGFRLFSVALLTIGAGILMSPSVHAREMSLSVGYRTLSSDGWDRFVAMDTVQGVWDTGPTGDLQNSAYGLALDYEFSRTEWGMLVGRLEALLPKSIQSTGTPQGESPMTKTSSLWGVRAAPVMRFFVDRREIYFFEAGLSLGALFLSQEIQGDRSGKLSANSIEVGARASFGVRPFPMARIKPVLRVGYDFSRSGSFSASKASGTAYSDFQSGDRLALRTAGGSEDFKVNTSGFHAFLGVSIPLGSDERTASKKPSQKSRTLAPVLSSDSEVPENQLY